MWYSSYTTLCQAGTAALNLPTSRWIGCASIFAAILRNFVTPAHKGNAFPFEHKNQLTLIFMLYPGLNLKTSFSIERGLHRPLRKMQKCILLPPLHHVSTGEGFLYSVVACGKNLIIELEDYL